MALGGLRSPASGHVLLAAANFILVFLVGGPLGEEFGWRGTPCPSCSADGVGISPAWSWGRVGLWHLPLFYSVGTAQSHLPMGCMR